MDIGLEEVEQAASLVQAAVHPDALTIFGATFDESMEDEICVTVIATGFDETIMNKKSGSAAPEKNGQGRRTECRRGEQGSEEDDPTRKSLRFLTGRDKVPRFVP